MNVSCPNGEGAYEVGSRLQHQTIALHRVKTSVSIALARRFFFFFGSSLINNYSSCFIINWGGAAARLNNAMWTFIPGEIQRSGRPKKHSESKTL